MPNKFIVRDLGALWEIGWALNLCKGKNLPASHCY